MTLTGYTANVRCAGESEIKKAALRELKTDRYTHLEWVAACEPGTDNHAKWNDTNNCRRETHIRAMVSGKAFVLDADVLVIAVSPRMVFVAECRMPKIRPGWPDISKRSYDGQWQSEVCSTLYGNRGGSGVGKRCGPFSGTGYENNRWKYCNYEDARYCNPDSMCAKEQAGKELEHWGREGVRSPHCKVTIDGKGYRQNLHTCVAPRTDENIQGCTQTRGKLDLINLLKKCFRKELKKGGFTIEKVCTYQSVAKTFKNVGNLKRYIASNAIGKSCVKHDAVGNCTDYGYAPPLKLKCSPAQIMMDGIAAAKKNNCFWYPQDRTTNSLNAMKMLNKLKKKAYWLARMALVPGAPHLAKYLMGFARLTEEDCLWTDQPEQPKPKDSQQCIKNVIVKSGERDNWNCPTANRLKAGKMCSWFPAPTQIANPKENKDELWTSSDYNCECAHPGLTSNKNSDEICKKTSQFASMEGCKKTVTIGDEIACAHCGNIMTNLDANGVFNHCEKEVVERCPAGCATCSQIIDANGAASMLTCMSCKSGQVPEAAADATVGPTCKPDGEFHNLSSGWGCRHFSTTLLTEAEKTTSGLTGLTEAAYKCEECAPGYAKLQGTDVCESINATRGCALGTLNTGNLSQGCTCRPGFQVRSGIQSSIDGKRTHVIEWLPENYMPNSMKAWELCEPKSDDDVSIMDTADSTVAHCIHERQDPYVILNADNFLWFPQQKRCRACESGYVLVESTNVTGSWKQKCRPLEAGEQGWNINNFCKFQKITIAGGVSNTECAMCANGMVWENGQCVPMEEEKRIANCELGYTYDSLLNTPSEAPATIIARAFKPAYKSSPRCFQCKFGHVVTNGGRSCRAKGKHGRGCRRESGNAHCEGCRLGFYQNYLNSNRHGCLPDPMYHCGEFRDNSKSTCACKGGALQISYHNNFCKLMTPTGADKFWGDIAHKNRLVYNDMCYKKKAIELMFCSEVKMLASPTDGSKTTYTGLNAAMQHWWSSPEWKAKFNGLKNARRIAESKKIIEDQLTHLKGYKSIGIDVACEAGHMVEPAEVGNIPTPVEGDGPITRTSAAIGA